MLSFLKTWERQNKWCECLKIWPIRSGMGRNSGVPIGDGCICCWGDIKQERPLKSPTHASSWLTQTLSAMSVAWLILFHPAGIRKANALLLKTVWEAMGGVSPIVPSKYPHPGQLVTERLVASRCSPLFFPYFSYFSAFFRLTEKWNYTKIRFSKIWREYPFSIRPKRLWKESPVFQLFYLWFCFSSLPAPTTFST